MKTGERLNASIGLSTSSRPWRTHRTVQGKRVAGADFVGRHNRLWLVEQLAFRTPRHPFGEYDIRKTA